MPVSIFVTIVSLAVTSIADHSKVRIVVATEVRIEDRKEARTEDKLSMVVGQIEVRTEVQIEGHIKDLVVLRKKKMTANVMAEDEMISHDQSRVRDRVLAQVLNRKSLLPVG